MARKALTALWMIGAAVLVPVLVAHGHDLATAVALLVTVCPAWLSVAALAEGVSYLTRGGATRAVLRAPTVGIAALAAITAVGDAVAYVLPFGFAAGGAVAVGQAHRRGVPRGAAIRAFGLVALVSVATLGAVAAAGFIVLVPGPGLLAAVATVAVAAAAWRWGLRGRLPPASLAAAAVGTLLSWLADLAVLAVAFVALGERPPWAGLVLAYCFGQAVSALPFTPGGLAVVEGGLTASLVAFGACPAGALTAVLLYRLISHWAVVPAGGLAWLLLRRRTADEFRAAPWSVLAEGDERCPQRT